MSPRRAGLDGGSVPVPAAARSRWRKEDLDQQPAVGRLLERDGSALPLRDGPHDRQPQSPSARSAGAGRPIETIEYPLALGSRDARPAVGHAEARLPVL